MDKQYANLQPHGNSFEDLAKYREEDIFTTFEI